TGYRPRPVDRAAAGGGHGRPHRRREHVRPRHGIHHRDPGTVLSMNPRILVVDDVPAMAEQYAYDLRRLGGYRTRIAAGGRQAMAALVEEDVDCMILDLEMPGMDGFEV